jgi:hypothetical protein
MSTHTPPRNVQSGVALPPAADPDPTEIAHGDRAEAVRYEPDPDQLVRVRHTQRPSAQLPPDIPSDRDDEAARYTSPDLAEVALPPFGPSVWEALPEDGAPPRPPPVAGRGTGRPARPPAASAGPVVRYAVRPDPAERRWRVERDGQNMGAFREKAQAVDAASAGAWTERQTGGAAEVIVEGEGEAPFSSYPVPPQG